MQPTTTIKPRYARRSGILVLSAVFFMLSDGARAQNPAAELAGDKSKEMAPSLREGMATIGRYADEVNRRVRQPAAAPAAAPAAPAKADEPGRANPRIDIGRDPFEVSAQLKEGRSGGRFMGLPKSGTLDLQRRIQVKALLRTAQGGIAQLVVNNKDIVTVMDKELIDLGDLGAFQVRINAEGLTLIDPSAPGKRVVLR
ncbi:MAG: hypothetical protein PHX38_00725 [Sulfuricella sp.]|nr:hypothetical protein [Sulfuricella sp.]